MSSYNCNTEWHLGQKTAADYFIARLIPVKVTPDEDNPDGRAYQTDTGLMARRFAACSKHLGLAIEQMEEESPGPFIVRVVREVD